MYGLIFIKNFYIFIPIALNYNMVYCIQTKKIEVVCVNAYSRGNGYNARCIEVLSI